MKEKYTTLLFDADNTLLDFDKAENEALKKVMTDYKLHITEENCRRYSEINDALWKKFEKGEIEKADIKSTRFREFFKFMKVEEDYDPLEVNNTYISYLREGGYVIEGANELCKALKEKGYMIYVITNGIAATQARRLSLSGLLPYIDDVFVSETIGFQKPKKEYFDYVLSSIKETDKNKILVIGDSLSSDIKGAENADLPYIWYNHRKIEIPDTLKAEAVISDIRELHDIL